jgi:hypothetical protein
LGQSFLVVLGGEVAGRGSIHFAVTLSIPEELRLAREQDELCWQTRGPTANRAGFRAADFARATKNAAAWLPICMK